MSFSFYSAVRAAVLFEKRFLSYSIAIGELISNLGY